METYKTKDLSALSSSDKEFVREIVQDWKENGAPAVVKVELDEI